MRFPSLLPHVPLRREVAAGRERPAASVDNDSSSEVAAAPPAAPSSSSTTVVTVGPHSSSRNAGKKRASLSSLSLDSRSSDYDSYFYI